MIYDKLTLFEYRDCHDFCAHCPALAFAWVYVAITAAVGVRIAAAAAILIQLCFRTQARRSLFRRRQVSSRVATIAEAFSSIAWAATGALAAGGSWLVAVPVAFALAILGSVWLISPSWT